jgi:hypothetical protein
MIRQVRLYLLRARLANVQRQADGSDRWHCTGSDPVGERLGCTGEQRISHRYFTGYRYRAGFSSGYIRDTSHHSNEHLVAANKCGSWLGRADWAVPESVHDVRRQRCQDAQRQQPYREHGHEYWAPGRLQHDH